MQTNITSAWHRKIGSFNILFTVLSPLCRVGGLFVVPEKCPAVGVPAMLAFIDGGKVTSVLAGYLFNFHNFSMVLVSISTTRGLGPNLVFQFAD